jgi:monofunctional glycosyltransferase
MKKNIYHLFRWSFKFILVFMSLSIFIIFGLRYFNPPISSFMIQAKIQSNADRVTQKWVSFEDMSPYIKIAVIASEDQKFFEHHGFDIESIKKAWVDIQQGKRIRGASTISQQLAKNLFLWPSKSFFRKGMEAYFTGLIELMWSKQRILEVYLNIIEFGQGYYGVESASQAYYNVSVKNLSIKQGALLAAVLPNPHRFHVNKPSRYIIKRRDWIVQQIKQLGGKVFLNKHFQ